MSHTVRIRAGKGEREEEGTKVEAGDWEQLKHGITQTLRNTPFMS